MNFIELSVKEKCSRVLTCNTSFSCFHATQIFFLSQRELKSLKIQAMLLLVMFKFFIRNLNNRQVGVFVKIAEGTLDTVLLFNFLPYL